MINKILLTTSLVVVTILGVKAVDKMMAQKESTTTLASASPGEKLEGYVLEQPKYDHDTDSWRFKFAPRKNKELEKYYLVVSVRAKTKHKAPYYAGDYVKLSANYKLLKPVAKPESQETDRGIANEATQSSLLDQKPSALDGDFAT